MPRPKSSIDRRHFTAAARAAAIASRLRKREFAVPLDTPEVFIVRAPTAPGWYVWEIRRFGAVVLDRCLEAFACPNEARAAGLLALKAVGGAPAIAPLGEG